MDDLTYEALKKSVEFAIGVGAVFFALEFFILSFLCMGLGSAVCKGLGLCAVLFSLYWFLEPIWNERV